MRWPVFSVANCIHEEQSCGVVRWPVFSAAVLRLKGTAVVVRWDVFSVAILPMQSTAVAWHVG